jgi:predicted site-specific integrase-resolvase
MTKRVAIYARISTDSQTTKNQLRELRAVARRHSWTVVEVFVDHALQTSVPFRLPLAKSVCCTRGPGAGCFLPTIDL